MNFSSATNTAHYKIGVIRASLTTPLRWLHKEYASLYARYRVEVQSESAIRIEVIPTPISLRHRRRYRILVNGHERFAPTRREEVLPYVEWGLNVEIPHLFPQYLQLHASAMEIEGCGAIFPGASGNGKSTLTAGLLARRWRYFCDEFALIDCKTHMLHPYPRALCIKKPSFGVIEQLGLKFHGRRRYLKGAKGAVGYINPSINGTEAIGRTCPIRYIIFPKFKAGADPALIPISRAEAVFALHPVCFNLLNCKRTGLDVLTEVARSAECYRLITGDIERTCDLVEQLVRTRYRRQAKSA